MSRLIVEQDVWMSTRDGIRLAADVYRPDDDAPHPVLLHRTPYGKSTASLVSALVADPIELVRNGYVVVVQDVRGRFRSEGEWEPFIQEQDDGYDAVEWAAAQPWSDGNVGIYGSSYVAFTSYQAATARPPHLKTAVPIVGNCNYMGGCLRTGGLFELGFNVTYALMVAFDAIKRLPEAEKTVRRQLLARAMADPWAILWQVPLNRVEVLRGLLHWNKMIEEEPDSEYWASSNLEAHPERIQVPLLQVVAYQDWLSPNAIRLFERIQRTGPHRLVAGPWSHGGAYDGHCGARDYRGIAPGGPAFHMPLIVSWFDRWLKGKLQRDSGLAVRYFQNGENRWLESESWPPPGSQVTFYLDSGGHANSRSGDGRLTTGAAGSGPEDRFRYDPHNPVPTKGGLIFFLAPVFVPDGVQDQGEVEERDDVLVYTSEKLDVPVRIAGGVFVRLFASSSAEDTDFVAKLVDVEPNGYAANVTEGGLRARYRNGRHADWLTPGNITEFTIELMQTAHTFQPGHRLRLEISSSNFPRFSRNLNSRALPETGTEEDILVAEQRIFHSPAYPSCLILRVMGV